MKKQNAILTFTFITMLGVALLVSVLAIVDLDSTIIEQRKTINQHEHEAEMLKKKIQVLEAKLKSINKQ
jgi:competence protein ComGC